MRHYIWLTPVIVASTLVLPGCDKKQDDRAPSSESSPPAATAPVTTGAPASAPSTPMSDSDLEKMIRAKLESDDALKQAKLSVSADAKENKATISGTVVSQDMRAKAVDLAKSAQPGIAIEDKIDVKPSA
jgi:BON domain-containing protein